MGRGTGLHDDYIMIFQVLRVPIYLEPKSGKPDNLEVGANINVTGRLL